MESSPPHTLLRSKSCKAAATLTVGHPPRGLDGGFACTATWGLECKGFHGLREVHPRCWRKKQKVTEPRVCRAPGLCGQPPKNAVKGRDWAGTRARSSLPPPGGAAARLDLRDRPLAETDVTRPCGGRGDKGSFDARDNAGRTRGRRRGGGGGGGGGGATLPTHLTTPRGPSAGRR